ncbi:MAG: virulence RhuM family protein [Muribaculaceae bacterium]|nr:virulence RhuM family protein [Muribaculaceae bacterium]
MNMDRGEIVLYQTQNGESKIEVRLANESVWLTLDQMADLFQRNKSTISRHIKAIIESGELDRNSVVAENATTASDGKTYQVSYYNLDMIISVGYRVNSHRGVQFRIWATQVLKEYMIKGFALNDELLKNAGHGNYFDELLARIRDIRSSEKVFYRKILEIYALSIDYDPRTSITQQFFKTVQNKMHFAAHGHTAAEVIYNRADAEKDFMGLTTWSGMMPTKQEAEIAKNYLSESELNLLNRIVTLYLDFAELQAERHIPMYMKDWIKKLDEFLSLSGSELLKHAGTVSAEMAKIKADEEYEKFKNRTKYQLSAVEIHFLENFEREQKKLKSSLKQ